MNTKKGTIFQFLHGVNPAEIDSQENNYNEYRKELTVLATIIKHEFDRDALTHWTSAWILYKRQIRELSRSFRIPVGIVFANVVDKTNNTI